MAKWDCENPRPDKVNFGFLKEFWEDSRCWLSYELLSHFGLVEDRFALNDYTKKGTIP